MAQHDQGMVRLGDQARRELFKKVIFYRRFTLIFTDYLIL
jgi:hypothetical protein